eukprot:966445-Pyramimonas_sp.AAC.2
MYTSAGTAESDVRAGCETHGNAEQTRDSAIGGGEFYAREHILLRGRDTIITPRATRALRV